MVLSQNSLSVTIVLTDRVIRLLKSIIIGPSVLRRLNYERLKKNVHNKNQSQFVIEFRI